MPSRTFLAWSSGKDSAWALHVLRQQYQLEPIGLVTTINAHFQRVAMHAVRLELLQQQAAATGIPLHLISIPYPCTNAEYEAAFRNFLVAQHPIDALVFGDLFLEDIRAYRERQLADTGIQPCFPLWQQPTRALAESMLAAGLKACVTCVDTRCLPVEFSGAEYNQDFLRALPSTVDPCGENGEFHTFAYAGPMFSHPIPVRRGARVERDGFAFTDLLSAA